MTAAPTLRPGHLPRVPTLTEVIDVPEGKAALPGDMTQPAPPAPAVPIAAFEAEPATGTAAAPEEHAVPAAPAPSAAPAPAVQAAVPPSPALTPLEEQQLTQKVLADVQQRIDLMFEYRLREALAPALARLTDAVLRDARVELATTLRDVVARAVAQELSRHRQR